MHGGYWLFTKIGTMLVCIVLVVLKPCLSWECVVGKFMSHGVSVGLKGKVNCFCNIWDFFKK